MLTPFAGAGSECVAAKVTGRNYIGFEVDEAYCTIAEERLLHAEEESQQITLASFAKMTKTNSEE